MLTVCTPEEAAALLKVHVNTVYRLLRRGVLPAAKTGRDWRIAEDVLDDYLHGRLPQGKALIAKGAEAEDRSWLLADLSRLGEMEPYEWGAEGVPEGQPVRYLLGMGPVVEDEESGA